MAGSNAYGNRGAETGAGPSFGILGPLQASGWAGPVRLPGARQRVVLAVLLVRENRVVPIDDIIDQLWPQEPPATARSQVMTVVSTLRRLLDDGGQPGGRRLLVTRTPGYLIEVAPGEVDALRFDALLRGGDEQIAAGRSAAAAGTLRAALALWRGEPLVDVPAPFAAVEAKRLAEIRLAATEKLVDLEFGLGRHGELVAELSRLVAEHPLRERLRGQLMTALNTVGRRPEALAVFRDGRRHLIDELGLEPGTQLRRLEQAILTGTEPVGSTLGKSDPPDRAGSRATGSDPVPARLGSAPTGTEEAVPRQLPLDVRGFTGRGAELARLDGMLPEATTSAAIATLSGGPGVGKTALAVHWAHRVRDRFPDGQLYVNLRGFDPAGTATDPIDALRGLLDALRVSAGRIPARPDEQAALYRSLLADRRVLVVLDNARDAKQVRPLLPGSPGCLAVITSRNPLTGLIAAEGAQPIGLELFTPDEARELLARRLGTGRVSDDPDAIGEIVARCARLPLALAIVAARAATNPAFPLAELAAELRTADGRLAAFDGGDAATRIHSVFSWSYETVSEAAARLFRLLAAHPGPDIAVPAAASLAGTSREQARALLRELAEAQLIAEHRPGRYGFHDLLRAYATELAERVDSPQERLEATRRALDHYLHTALACAPLTNPFLRPPPHQKAPAPGVEPESFADAREATAWVLAERVVLAEAVSTAAAAGFDCHVWQLVWAHETFLRRRGYEHEMIKMQRLALQAAKRTGDPQAQAHALMQLGARQTKTLHDPDAGGRNLRLALDLYRDLGDHHGQADVYLSLCTNAEPDYATALAYASKCLELYRLADHTPGQGRALGSIGWYKALLGDLRAAAESCRSGLDLSARADDVIAQGHMHDSLGYVHSRLGEHDQAISDYLQAVAIFHEVGDKHAAGTSLTTLGETYLKIQDQQAAYDTWQQALDLFDELDHPDADRVRTLIKALPDM